MGGGQWSRSLVGPNANVHLNDSLADVEVVMGGQMLSRGAGERSGEQEGEEAEGDEGK